MQVGGERILGVVRVEAIFLLSSLCILAYNADSLSAGEEGVGLAIEIIMLST